MAASVAAFTCPRSSWRGHWLKSYLPTWECPWRSHRITLSWRCGDSSRCYTVFHLGTRKAKAPFAHPKLELMELIPWHHIHRWVLKCGYIRGTTARRGKKWQWLDSILPKAIVSWLLDVFVFTLVTSAVLRKVSQSNSAKTLKLQQHGFVLPSRWTLHNMSSLSSQQTQTHQSKQIGQLMTNDGIRTMHHYTSLLWEHLRAWHFHSSLRQVVFARQG